MKTCTVLIRQLRNMLPVLLPLFLSSTLFAQTFQTAIGYPTPTDERGVSGLVNAGNYLILGSNLQHPSGFFNGAGDLQLLRLDALGNVIQPGKIIGQDVGESGVWIEKAQDCSGAPGYIIAGNEFNGGANNMLLMLTNIGGTPLWVRRIGTANTDETSACVQQDGAGNFILVGTKTNAGAGQSAIQAVKTDCGGNLLWERVYNFGVSATAASVTAFATQLSVCGNLPNEYYITGKVTSAAGGNEEVFILSVNAANGAPVFLNTYDIAPNADDVGTYIQGKCSALPPATGGLWVSGYSLDPAGSDPKKVLMLHTDLGGNVLWANNYDVQNSTQENATHFQFTANDRLVLTGKAEDSGVSDPPENGKCLLMRMTDDGATVDWTRVFDMGFASQGNRVEPTPNDEYFITGHTYEIIQPHVFDYNMLAIKTDKIGQTTSACFHSPPTVVIKQTPKVVGVTPVIVIPQDFFQANLLNVLYQEKQTFCPQPPPNPCDSIAINANFSYSVSGNTVTFTDLSTVGSGTIFSWNWDFGDSNTGTGPNPVHTYSGPGTYVVCLIVTAGANGVVCRDTICKDVIIPVVPHDPCDSILLNANFSYTVSGNTVTFTDLSTIGSGSIFGWNWDFGDSNTSTNQNPVHTYSGPGAYVVCLIVTGGNAVALCRDTICKDVIIQTPPKDTCKGNIVLNGNFSQGLTPGNLDFGGTCANWNTWTNSPQVILFDTCMDAGAIQMWGDQVVGESITQPVSFQQGGIYEVSFCGKWLNTVQGNVSFRFRASNGFPSSYLNCSGNCDQIYLSPIMTTSWVTYTSAPWTATQNYNTLTISVWNNFALNDGAYVSWARIDDVCIRRIGTSASGNLPDQLPVSLFPNPTSGDVTLQFGTALTTRTRCTVVDFTGRTLLQTSAEAGSEQQLIHLGNLPAGMYIIRVAGADGAVWTGKVVRE